MGNIYVDVYIWMCIFLLDWSDLFLSFFVLYLVQFSQSKTTKQKDTIDILSCQKENKCLVPDYSVMYRADFLSANSTNSICYLQMNLN